MISQDRKMLSAQEVAAIYSFSLASGYKLIRLLNNELKEQGFLCPIQGKVDAKYFYRRCFSVTDAENKSDKERKILTAKEVATILSVSESKAYRIIHKLNEEYKEEGFIAISGRIEAAFFYKHYFHKETLSSEQEERKTLTAKEIADIFCVSLSTGSKILQELNKEIKKQGLFFVHGKVDEQYFYKRCFADPVISFALERKVLTAADVGRICHHSEPNAYKSIHAFNNELADKGLMFVHGKIDANYFYNRIFSDPESALLDDKKKMITAEEISEILAMSESSGYRIIHRLNEELKSKGLFTFQGRIERRYLYTRLFAKIDDNDVPDYEDRCVIDAAEVAKKCDTSESYAYKLIQKLNKELEAKGYLTVQGKVDECYFISRLFAKVEPSGYDDIHKELLTPEDVAKICKISVSRAYKVIAKLNEEKKEKGGVTISGRISNIYLYTRMFGYKVEDFRKMYSDVV